MFRTAFPAIAGIVLLLFGSLTCGTSQGVDIVWDGGDGDWNDDPLLNGEPGKWNGGMVSFDVFGSDTQGWVFGNNPIGSDVFINSGNVTFDNSAEDFRFLAGAPENGGTLTIGAGPGSPASLSMEISQDEGADQDGQWAQFNASALNLNNGTFHRIHVPDSTGDPSSGGLFSFGGIRGFPNADINVNMTNGGTIINDGQLTFGWYLQDEDAVGRKVTFNIDDGHLDLTGAANWDHAGVGSGDCLTDNTIPCVGSADLAIHYGWDPVNDVAAGEEYAINFTGPGTIKVDEGGILVIEQTAIVTDPENPAAAFNLASLATRLSYEDLWDMGILQADGVSGTTGAGSGGDPPSFSDFFMVTNNVGDVDYTLTSLVGPDLLVVGDMNGDGIVNFGDLTPFSLGLTDIPAYDAAFPELADTRVQRGDVDLDTFFNFGDLTPFVNLLTGPGSASGSAVPEPSALALLTLGMLGLSWRRRGNVPHQ